MKDELLRNRTERKEHIDKHLYILFSLRSLCSLRLILFLDALSPLHPCYPCRAEASERRLAWFSSFHFPARILSSPPGQRPDGDGQRPIRDSSGSVWLIINCYKLNNKKQTISFDLILKIPQNSVA